MSNYADNLKAVTDTMCPKCAGSGLFDTDLNNISTSTVELCNECNGTGIKIINYDEWWIKGSIQRWARW